MVNNSKVVKLEDMPIVANEIIAMIGTDATVSLEGDLGAGKTTLVQCILKELGYQGRVKSPTYNIIEEYLLPELKVYHLDLYRIVDPNELEYLAVDDIFSVPCIRFIEWYKNAANSLAKPDYIIQIEYQGESRKITINQ